MKQMFPRIKTSKNMKQKRNLIKQKLDRKRFFVKQRLLQHVYLLCLFIIGAAPIYSTIFCKQILPNARCFNNYWIWCVQRHRERVCFQLCFVVLASVKHFGRFCSFLSISCTHTCIRAATAAKQYAPRAIDQPNYWTFVVNVGHFECVKIETIYVGKMRSKIVWHREIGNLFGLILITIILCWLFHIFT